LIFIDWFKKGLDGCRHLSLSVLPGNKFQTLPLCVRCCACYDVMTNQAFFRRFAFTLPGFSPFLTSKEK
jgi:hypothetical protein